VAAELFSNATSERDKVKAQSTKLEFITFTHKFLIVKECEILEGTVPSLHVGSHAEWIVWNVTVEKYKLQGTVRLRVL
jgi:hypothetical protein